MRSTELTIHLKAYHPAMEYAWRNYSEEFENVVTSGDILREKADAIVSPANSFGYMDGGLPVGQAVIVETSRDDIPYLISAPTMRVPMNIEETVNVYHAFRAVLRAVAAFNAEHPGAIRSILSPALGTGERRMPYERCAWQMYYAYAVCVLGRVETMGGLAGAVENHIDLLR